MSVLNLIGKKGTVEILRLLSLGVNSFTKIKENLNNSGLSLSTRTLAQRLNELEGEYLIEKNNGKYYITQKGKEFLDIIENILAWEKRWEDIKINKIVIDILKDRDS
ncbi:winged helix-turn-helix transcriptional regulator [Methanocaldococcus infernus]|uniref:Transcriptional regulator, HxlR family n=1 Tax=Methanocaldococcus infernus (strain DSM 11812 / JCM 15783 / ME) TaxID=573063 RepID=D5VR15_METIM|nr:helix-turn-helix domain-containing protein [Methanocaldococcus infernus]ADG13018.1 transcriptional regulator, HxlR family [Methanocaldococcus infernus ME]